MPKTVASATKNDLEQFWQRKNFGYSATEARAKWKEEGEGGGRGGGEGWGKQYK